MTIDQLIAEMHAVVPTVVTIESLNVADRQLVALERKALKLAGGAPVSTDLIELAVESVFYKLDDLWLNLPVI